MGVGALGMPLDPDGEMVERIELDSLNDPVVRGNRADEQIVAGYANCLVVAGIHLRRQPLICREQAREP